MKPNRTLAVLLAGALTASSAAPAGAPNPLSFKMVTKQGLDAAVISHAVKTIERGHARAMGRLSEGTLRQLDALEMADPFEHGPFPPNELPGMTWAMRGIDSDTSLLCVSFRVPSADAWVKALKGLTNVGMSAADANTCSELPGYGVPPAAYPTLITGVKVLDRRDVPLPTVIPEGIRIDGADATAVMGPGVILRSGAQGGYTDLVLTNQAVVLEDGAAGEPANPRLSISSVELRPGFGQANDCGELHVGASCRIRLSYDGLAGDYRVGSLRLEFSDGSVAVIGLLGRTR
ncbi:hypothetical protein [Ramlibacter alkalitolerans]|uniref:Uncharacterized protein n=1 Tax=Ramlibacter alkalitolerans TaxID=2039631 RepID=A0ABS1JU88_9BURK|nr:hypothetical protein [Ramlibacter alkalitolerans]MBL0427731.1 hypothetical protein [Ramlibacter alkalitolerans]